ncbi:MAG: ankyrin repeat domain-containing protein [Wolbachia endosymbiont of Fragariocoptes setiger]|nr:ankyrin repeat domain-containing protein [Wolbachia endosymbiont of Fragariocoptes setiger]
MINITTSTHNENLVSSSSDVVNSPTYHICDTNNDDLVSSSIDARNSEGKTELHYVTIERDIEKAIDLINKGANPNLQDHRGKTPLYYGISSEYAINIFNCAFASNYHGVNFHVRDIDQKTYLHHAIEIGNVQLIEYIIHHCRDLMSSQDNLEDTPIHITVLFNKIDTFRLLINTLTSEELKNIIDMQDFLNYTALHYAVQNESLEMTNELLQREANPNLQGFHGSTPLHTAVEYNNMTLVETLLRNGAMQNISRDFITKWSNAKYQKSGE